MYDFLDKLNLNKKDTLLVSSNIISLSMQIKSFDANVFIDNLKNRVNTLLFPAFNYQFCEGKDFDYDNTPPSTLMGSLSLVAFKRKDFKRTKHPVFSFMVAGEHQKDFINLNNIDAFGKDSPFGLLYNLKAKMLFIDIDYNKSFTYVHFVEHQENASYRYHKKFSGNYIKNNKKEYKTYKLFVRDLEKGVENNINPTGKILEENEVAVKYNIFNSDFILVDLYKAYDIIADQVNHNQLNLVRFTK